MEPPSDKVGDEGDTCRICRGEGSVEEPLFYPCKCSGSIKFVHQDCLMEWLSHSQKKYCELCKTPFRFTKLYHPTMPSRIPTSIFLRRAALHLIRMVGKCFRALLVAAVWLVILPYSVRMVWRSLFWMGDAGMLQPRPTRMSNIGMASISNAEPLRRTIDSTIGTTHTDNSMWIPVLFLQLSNMSAVEIMKALLFGLFPTDIVIPTEDGPTARPVPMRHPTLLSGVSFLHCFNSERANRLLIYVLEGQIITLGIVVGFILIFLIREWVVQQQPVINMAALAAEPIPAPVPERVEVDHNPQGAGDDLVGFEHETEDDSDSDAGTHEHVHDDENTESDQARTVPTQGESSESARAGVEGGCDPRVRPNMPARDRSFIANEIRRSMEEGETWSFRSVPETTQERSDSTRDHLPDNWDDEGPDTVGEDTSGGTDEVRGQGSERSSESWQHIEHVLTNPGDAVEEQGHDMGSEQNAATMSTAIQNAFNPEQDDALAAMDPPEWTQSAGSPATSEDEAEMLELDSARAVDIPNAGGVANLELVPQPRRQAARAARNPWERLLDWVYGDIAPDAHADDGDANDERVVQDMGNEAPFVPFEDNEPRPAINPPVQDPEVAAAAARAGINLNDEEAIEAAEDLEGIMELIGMQGPLIGLFQNVVFCSVLVVLTLAFAVWVPYLLGKGVFLCVAHPVAFLLKIPLRAISGTVDLIADTGLFLISSVISISARTPGFFVKRFASLRLFEVIQNLLDSVSMPAETVSRNAGERLGRWMVGLQNPDARGPQTSISSLMALRAIQRAIKHTVGQTATNILDIYNTLAAHSVLGAAHWIVRRLHVTLLLRSTKIIDTVSTLASWIWKSSSYKMTLDLDWRKDVATPVDTIEVWTATDRLVAVLAGYALIAMLGAIYLKYGPVSSSQQGRKLENAIAEVLHQAGGVLKVILIISIEMLVFPLYCGLLLDFAMLPLFQHASLHSRWQYATQNPWTSGFVHWFIGTCYMFHFALFVSMCRKILRKGVLYFIRDPDDPTFHPVRDVLERSVATQLRKIAFSGLVYGVLIVVCLGGVVWGLEKATIGVLPIRWATTASSIELPLDLFFYNFLTPFILSYYKPSDAVHEIYQWWFKNCARVLRLSNFLLGEKIPAEEGHHAGRAYFTFDGRYVRAPASDQTRIPKGETAFVEVDEFNRRKDGKEEGGVHNSDMVIKVYLPPHFRVRIALFVLAIWAFAAATGLGVSILPLLFGRRLFSLVLSPAVQMNDIHALSLGLYTMAAIAYVLYQLWNFLSSLREPESSSLSRISALASTAFHYLLRVARICYVWGSIALVIPTLFAFFLEFYLILPLHEYLGPGEPHVVHIIQDWTLGFLYGRLLTRIMFADRNSRPGQAWRAIIADGFLDPNARITTRCFLAPAVVFFTVAAAVPMGIAWTLNHTFWAGAPADTRSEVWRFSFPVVGMAFLAVWLGRAGVRMINRWRMVVRDEVYLIGERLHNFGEKRPPQQGGQRSPDAVAV
ncbi:uncharacterized protein EI97DRAFT_377478 [Westerdykella ornata]|uniref:RING-type E3 ubiquitin transferase n=1 Tax=Westerdykella ornata TaxID=318751 RepID=A0A6A6JJ73_WESOR|nr:uncharacterized protein EI97DRAFT_377478 [Westerdykella ornata]KAF2276304.1 hypothetical protein EI97DRAFT_377478 [Westerdykella ornata]